MKENEEEKRIRKEQLMLQKQAQLEAKNKAILLKKEKKQKAKLIQKEKDLEEKILAKKRDKVWNEMITFEKEHSKEEKIAPADSCISLQHINKIYSNHVQAVFDFNLEIKEKEFIVLVGPSGCGKSTTLRMIAGLEDITSGDLYIDGTYANDLEPKERDVAMVFQSYALYPHMTVFDNLAFGLQMRHIPKDEIEERVLKAAKILEIEEYLDRKPKALSGGQCQRVALGRAIVRNTKIFLMDEPLSNLDAKLRVQMRSELVKLHNELNSTTVYVTHDQTEAMTMATRIVVMKKGYVQQIGTPKEIYNHPSNTFVATFIGSPAMNILKASYTKSAIKFANGYQIPLTSKIKKAHDEFYKKEIEDLQNKINEMRDSFNAPNYDGDVKKDDFLKDIKEKEISEYETQITTYLSYLQIESHEILFGIRPEDVIQKGFAVNETKLTSEVEVEVSVAELLGNEYYIHTSWGKDHLIGKVNAGQEIYSKDHIFIHFNLEKIHLFDTLSTKYIL